MAGTPEPRRRARAERPARPEHPARPEGPARPDRPERARRGRSAKSALSEEAIIEAGLRVLRSDGIDAITMRRVAIELDTGAASLYVYVGGRDELLKLLFDRAASEVPSEPGDPTRWRQQVRDLALNTLRVLESYPGIARVALADVPTGHNSLDGAEGLMSALLAGGIEPQRAAWAADTIFLLVTANAVETDTMRERTAATGESDEQFYSKIPGIFRALPAERFPTITKYVNEMTSGDSETRFLFSIDTFLDGLQR